MRVTMFLSRILRRKGKTGANEDEAKPKARIFTDLTRPVDDSNVRRLPIALYGKGSPDSFRALFTVEENGQVRIGNHWLVQDFDTDEAAETLSRIYIKWQSDHRVLSFKKVLKRFYLCDDDLAIYIFKPCYEILGYKVLLNTNVPFDSKEISKDSFCLQLTSEMKKAGFVGLDGCLQT